MCERNITILRARLKGEVEYPWIYFHSIATQPLSYTFIHLARSIRTQQSVLIEKSVTPKDVKKAMRDMFHKVIGLQQSNTFTGLEVDILEKFSEKDRIEGLTVMLHCLRKTKQEALAWLMTNNHNVHANYNYQAIDPETIRTLSMMAKK